VIVDFVAARTDKRVGRHTLGINRQQDNDSLPWLCNNTRLLRSAVGGEDCPGICSLNFEQNISRNLKKYKLTFPQSSVDLLQTQVQSFCAPNQTLCSLLSLAS
jgi:hypothetical protein